MLWKHRHLIVDYWYMLIVVGERYKRIITVAKRLKHDAGRPYLRLVIAARGALPTWEDPPASHQVRTLTDHMRYPMRSGRTRLLRRETNLRRRPPKRRRRKDRLRKIYHLSFSFVEAPLQQRKKDYS